MAPGGGGSGNTTNLNYVSQYHSQWIGNVQLTDDDGSAVASEKLADANNINTATADFNIATELITAKALNPFTGVSAFNPDAIFADIDDKCLDFLDLVSDLDPEGILDTAISLATEQADTIFNNTAQVNAAVAAFEARGQDAFLRSASRSYSSLLGARAVMTGMWDNTVAYMENQRQLEVNDYDAKIRLTREDQRIAYIQTTAQNLIALIGQQLESFRAATELRMKTGAMQIAGKNDQITADMALDKNEVLWALDMFPTYVAGMISSYTGGVPSSREPSVGDKVMAGLFGVGQLLVGAAPLLAKLK